ncbi:hypothetical protein H257_17543 [Aphanomyces astaci]|uniref:Uncharacterized protein n=1 Tax=Aphanomyces astaci TaxID=112090 RepID=W4FG03_APHAT|nr:hypothetical protein H257_17543 [Aphanomyces astaci]ETV65799.1 hypothetical protein H257_17543 [Aphanomyces astaci]|eukprot:XP_009844662.1 hypothetical protein H257_17543 [Aphanomyces astaci]
MDRGLRNQRSLSGDALRNDRSSARSSMCSMRSYESKNVTLSFQFMRRHRCMELAHSFMRSCVGALNSSTRVSPSLMRRPSMRVTSVDETMKRWGSKVGTSHSALTLVIRPGSDKHPSITPPFSEKNLRSPSVNTQNTITGLRFPLRGLCSMRMR